MVLLGNIAKSDIHIVVEQVELVGIVRYPVLAFRVGDHAQPQQRHTYDVLASPNDTLAVWGSCGLTVEIENEHILAIDINGGWILPAEDDEGSFRWTVRAPENPRVPFDRNPKVMIRVDKSTSGRTEGRKQENRPHVLNGFGTASGVFGNSSSRANV